MTEERYGINLSSITTVEKYICLHESLFTIQYKPSFKVNVECTVI